VISPSGKIKIGAIDAQVETTGVRGNGTDYIQWETGIDISFTISQGSVTKSGKVKSMNDIGDKIFLFDTTITETDFAGDTLTVTGQSFLVDYSGIDTCIVNTTPTLSFKVWDDDQITGDVPMPDTSDLERVFNPAYVLPVFDVGDNNDNVEFKLNVKATEFQSTLDWDSKPYNVNTFWIGYVLGGYQYLSVKDYDPDGETATGGVTDITYGGCIIFKETLQDTNPSFELIAVDHEIGHLLGGEHTDGALMRPEGDTEFSPITLNRIRSIVKPTGN